MSAFLDLQNGYYNALTQALGFAPGSPIQLVQPAPPLPVPTNDAVLFAYFNNIPPDSLTQNYIASGGNQFKSTYAAVLSAMVAPKSTFVADIGPDCFKDWKDFLKQLPPDKKPDLLGLSQAFYNWAIVDYPDIAEKGATDLTLLTKDPIGAGIAALNTYDDANGTQEWSRGFNDLTAELAQAPRLDFSFDSATANSSTASAWASNSESAFFGVWSSASSSSAQSQEFASSRVSLAGSFDHVTTFAVSPGKWFNSETLANAYAHSPSTPPPTPWNPNSAVNWDNTFGPNGNFVRVCANLIVVSGMHLTVTSQATFSRADQDTIQSNSSAGMWPFYTRNDGANSHNEVKFDSSGRMTATISSVPAVPIVLACTVIPMKQYVGHQLKAFAATARR